ncbi:MAG: serine hydrolase domain-containing protein [Alphaproteobacteria bacterium]
MLIRATLAAATATLLSFPLHAQTVSNMNTLANAAASAAQNGDPLPRGKAEDVGMSSERLGEIARVINADIEQGRLPGAVIAVARRGKLVYYEAFGFRDKAAGVAMTKDTIFNIASMTKPMVALAALQLQERGKLLVDDPLSKYFPQFAKMEVAELNESGDAITGKVPAKQPITLRHLMMHTSGLIYGGRGNTAVHKLYPGGSGVAGTTMDGAQFMDALAKLPLLNHPGAVWDYGFGLDLLGQVVERVSGQKLGQYFEANIFKPLGMNDTGFFIPPEKAARYAKALDKDPDTGQAQTIAPVLTQPLKFECGGGCLSSTVSDYMRFALALLNKGAYGETRILGRKTAEYMLTNQMGPDVKSLIANADPTREGYGFGLGLSVRTEAGRGRVMGSVGDFSWPGASGTNWWADPKEELAVVFMAHSPGPIRWHYRQVINALVYQSIVD